MKITFGYGENKSEISIAKAIKMSLDANDYGVGHIEAIDSTVGNVAQAFGDLVQLLYEKGVLVEDEVKPFLGYKVDIE